MMRVIIEIPPDSNYVDVTVTRVWIEKETKEPCLDTMHRGYDVEELEIVHESCDVCNGHLPFDEKNYCENCGAKLEEKQEPLGDFEDDWSIKDETE